MRGHLFNTSRMGVGEGGGGGGGVSGCEIRVGGGDSFSLFPL